MIKPVLYITFTLFTVFSLKAQENLVPNGSFEEYWDCPISNELNNGQFEKAIGWWRPTDCTPDYFNRCNSSVVGVPNNFWGYQEAYHGDGYVGFIPIMDGSGLEYEYFRTELISSLKPCVEYHFKMYVSLANFSTHGVGKIGAFFSKENDIQYDCKILNKAPQVKYMGVPIIDTINWTKIEGSFVADGFEKYITIGYFQDENSIDTVFIQEIPSSSFDFHTYYYVDSISLVELGEITLCEFSGINFPNVLTPNNDGINDFISIEKYAFFVEDIIIMNRWGNIVATLNDNYTYWSGENCPDGVYYYIIHFKDYNKQQTGFIHLIR